MTLPRIGEVLIIIQIVVSMITVGVIIGSKAVVVKVCTYCPFANVLGANCVLIQLFTGAPSSVFS